MIITTTIWSCRIHVKIRYLQRGARMPESRFMHPGTHDSQPAYFALKSGFIVIKFTGTETCSWLISHWPFTFL
jgi:hypothetical protein